MVAIAREAPANNLCDDVGSTLYSMLIALQDNCCATTARNETIAAGIEGTARFLGLVLANGECLNAVEGCDAVHVVLFCTAANYAILQALRDEERSQTNTLRT